MTVTVQVLERRKEDELRGKGKYEFVQLPAAGDRLFLHSHTIGPTEIVEVLYLEHHPVAVPKHSTARPDPTVDIVVRYLTTPTDH